MNIERLIEMAHDIAAFFDTERDEDVAVESIRKHLERNWDPRMRRQLIEYVAKHGADSFAPRVRAAVTGLALPTRHEPAGTLADIAKRA